MIALQWAMAKMLARAKAKCRRKLIDLNSCTTRVAVHSYANVNVAKTGYSDEVSHWRDNGISILLV